MYTCHRYGRRTYPSCHPDVISFRDGVNLPMYMVNEPQYGRMAGRFLPDDAREEQHRSYTTSTTLPEDGWFFFRRHPPPRELGKHRVYFSKHRVPRTKIREARP